jgi:hypothetical protein
MTVADFTHDPNSILPYTVDWTGWLAEFVSPEVEITGHSIIADAGITVVTSSNTTSTVTAVVTGGTPGVVYNITYRVTLSEGPPYTADQSIRLIVNNL